MLSPLSPREQIVDHHHFHHLLFLSSDSDTIKPSRKLRPAHKTEQEAAQSTRSSTNHHKNYMQPEPSEVSQTAISDYAPSDQAPSTQHGLSRVDDDGAGLLSSEHSADEPGADPQSPSQSGEQIAGNAAFAASLQEQLGDVRANTRGRLNLEAESTPKKGSSTPSPPSGGVRITEYENASTPPIRKRQGPGFEVIKKTRSPGDKRSAIQELPNGESQGWRRVRGKAQVADDS